MNENINLEVGNFYLLENGNILGIEQDYDTTTGPRDWDHDSKFITFERDYDSPDENPFKTWDDMLKNFGVKWDEDKKRDMYSELAQLEEKALTKGIVILPVWKYDHSGVSYKAAERNPFPDQRWDSGLAGVIYEKRDRRNIDQVKDMLKAEVNEYDQWQRGDIYRFTEYDKHGDYIDDLGGFYNTEDIKDNISAKPIKDLGAHDDIANCLYENRKELKELADYER